MGTFVALIEKKKKMRRVKQQIAAILGHSVPVLNPKFMSAPLFIIETSSGQFRKQ